jgi:heme-degrading monooxygenase HmoA
MIVRSWRAEAADADGVAAYGRHLRETVLPELRGLPGFRGISLLRRDLAAGRSELLVLRRWDTAAAIVAFAGADPERAVVEPAARAVLAAYDDRVRHHEVVFDEAAS